MKIMNNNEVLKKLYTVIDKFHENKNNNVVNYKEQ